MIYLFATMIAAGILYGTGWLRFTQTGALKPLVNLTILGVTVEIKQPEKDGNDDTEG